MLAPADTASVVGPPTATEIPIATAAGAERGARMVICPSCQDSRGAIGTPCEHCKARVYVSASDFEARLSDPHNQIGLLLEGERAAAESGPGGRRVTYVPERYIDGGGFGTVYRGREIPSQETCAIKYLHAAGSGAGGNSNLTKHVVDLFRREAKVLERLQSAGSNRHIVGFREIFESEGKLYLVMDFVEGAESLANVIENHGDEGMPFPDAAWILDQILDGLSHAHEQRIFHRDMKPENVLLRSYGTRAESVVLVDFGLARVAGGTRGAGRLGVADHSFQILFGTPRFTAPEHFAARANLSEALRNARGTAEIQSAHADYLDATGLGVDIYAVGAIAAYMLSGRRPFAGELSEQVPALVKKGARPYPDELWGELTSRGTPRGVVDVLARALTRDPEARFGNAIEMRERFHAAVGPDVSVYRDLGHARRDVQEMESERASERVALSEARERLEDARQSERAARNEAEEAVQRLEEREQEFEDLSAVHRDLEAECLDLRAQVVEHERTMAEVEAAVADAEKAWVRVKGAIAGPPLRRRAALELSWRGALVLALLLALAVGATVLVVRPDAASRGPRGEQVGMPTALPPAQPDAGGGLRAEDTEAPAGPADAATAGSVAGARAFDSAPSGAAEATPTGDVGAGAPPRAAAPPRCPTGRVLVKGADVLGAGLCVDAHEVALGEFEEGRQADGLGDPREWSDLTSGRRDKCPSKSEAPDRLMLPVACVRPGTAATYCAETESGTPDTPGRLPTVEEWTAILKVVEPSCGKWSDPKEACARLVTSLSVCGKPATGPRAVHRGGQDTPGRVVDMAGNVAEYVRNGSRFAVIRSYWGSDDVNGLCSPSTLDVPRNYFNVGVGFRCVSEPMPQ